MPPFHTHIPSNLAHIETKNYVVESTIIIDILYIKKLNSFLSKLLIKD